MEFTVKRSKWARRTFGNTNGDSLLLNEKGNMCCLGFACSQLGGMADELLDGLCSPGTCLEANILSVPTILAEYDPEGFPSDTKLSNAAMCINDNSTTSDLEKEVALTKLFSEHGIVIKFED